MHLARQLKPRSLLRSCSSDSRDGKRTPSDISWSNASRTIRRLGTKRTLFLSPASPVTRALSPNYSPAFCDSSLKANLLRLRSHLILLPMKAEAFSLSSLAFSTRIHVDP